MTIDLLPKTSIEVVAKDKNAEEVITLIQRAAKTEKMGKGKIFQVPVEKMVRVRTDEVEA
jgi:nitrogen regulatory protein P-II 1